MIFYKAKTYFQGKFDFRDLYITACYYICAVSIHFKEDYRIIFIKTYQEKNMQMDNISPSMSKIIFCFVLFTLVSVNPDYFLISNTRIYVTPNRI